MAIISCPECGRQVSDKALKCPQCNYPIGNLEKQESLPLQVLQEEIQNIVSASGLTVKASSMGKTLLIKMQRPKDKPDKPVYSWLWIHITPKLKPEVLIGFNKLLITSNFEGDIQPEWEDQSDINEKGVRIPNKKEKKEAITGYVFLAILIVGFSSCSYFSNRPRPVETTSNTSTSNTSTSGISTSSPEYLLAGIDKQSKDVSASELAPYTQALDQLESKCQESRMALADLSSWTQDELKKKGVEATHLKIMNAVYQSVQPYTTPQKCNSSFALIPIIVNK
jgi:hypothetical protein